MQVSLSDIIGTFGVFLILVPYFLLQAEKVRYDDFSYLFLNVVGSAFITFSLIYDFNLSALLMEIIWIGISLYGLMKKIIKRQDEKHNQTTNQRGGFQGTPNYHYS